MEQRDTMLIFVLVGNSSLNYGKTDLYCNGSFSTCACQTKCFYCAFVL